MAFGPDPATSPSTRPAPVTARLLTSALLALLIVVPFAARAQQPSAVDTLLTEAHYLRARPLTQAELQKNANDVRALIHQSVLDWAFFRFDDAIATAEKAVALAATNAEAHTQLTNALGAKLVSSNAGTFEKMSLARRFRKEADLSLQLDPDCRNPNCIDAIEDAARFYQDAPGIVGGDKAHAQQLVDRVTRLDPARGAALKAGFLADDKDKARRDTATEALWKAAVAALPNSADAHAGLSSAYFDQGPARYPLAEAEARRAIALKPTRIAAYRQLAVLYATAGRWDDLDKILKQSRAAIPDNLSPDYQAAKVILVTSTTAQLTRAEQYLRAYLAQPAEGEEPSHAAAHWRLGLILEKQGRKNDAIQELQTAVHEDSSLDGAKKDLKRLS